MPSCYWSVIAVLLKLTRLPRYWASLFLQWLIALSRSSVISTTMPNLYMFLLNRLYLFFKLAVDVIFEGRQLFWRKYIYICIATLYEVWSIRRSIFIAIIRCSIIIKIMGFNCFTSSFRAGAIEPLSNFGCWVYMEF